MKLKRLPEDFRVEELPVAGPGDRGPFVFYRLTKRGIGTMEAVDAVCRRWNVDGRRVDFGGLKDRHAVTTQYLTILDGPERGLRERSFDLQPLGRVDRPYGPGGFRGNRFEVVLRDLDDDALGRARGAVGQLPRDGLPNYFDDQRFGSVGRSGAFVARAWIAGDYEAALRLAIAEPNASDRPGTAGDKAALRDLWGRWPEARARVRDPAIREPVAHLARFPGDVRGAFARVRREQRLLYFSAFQSHLWNLALGRVVERLTRPDQRVAVAFKAATLPVHRGLDPDQAARLSACRIPLPASRTPLPAEGLEREAALEVVAGQGLAWDDLRVKHLKDVFLSKGDRPALFFPDALTHESGADELAPGRKALRLAFELPKGAYATLLVKRVTDAAGPGRP